MADVQQTVQMGGNTLAVVAAGGSVMEYLPPTAAVFTIVWLTMQMIIHYPALEKRLREIFKRIKK